MKSITPATATAAVAELAAVRAELAAARAEIERLRDTDRWKTAFLAAAGHDLRAPLSVISIGARTLLEHGDLERGRQILERIDRQATRMDRLLSDLLDLDRYTRGDVQPDRRPTHLPSLVAQLVEGIPFGDHVLRTEVESVVAEVDPDRTAQIIANLLCNAITHTPAGTPVHLRAGAGDGGLSIVVDDEGPGVADELKAGLFEPFVSEPSHGGDVGGTGLGLSLARLFAQLHGGTAEVLDRPGGGARFVVHLPARIHGALDGDAVTAVRGSRSPGGSVPSA